MARQNTASAKVSRTVGKTRGRPEGSSGIATRQRLLEIAAKLFANNGFAGVTMADVAGEAGLTAPSIYNHFSSKDELFIATVTAMYENISQGFRTAGAVRGDWHARVDRLLEAAAAIYREDSVLQRLGGVAQLEAAQSPQRFAPILAAQQAVDQVFKDVVADAVSDQQLPDSIDPDLAGDLLAAMFMIAMAKVSHRCHSQTEFAQLIATFRMLFLAVPPVAELSRRD